jgi:hypothetical protein
MLLWDACLYQSIGNAVFRSVMLYPYLAVFKVYVQNTTMNTPLLLHPRKSSS